MKRVWLIGAGGMLGSSLRRKLEKRGVALFKYHEQLAWSDISRIADQFERAAASFMEGLGSDDEWDLYWVAGKGSMGSSDEELEAESVMQRFLLQSIQRHMKGNEAKGMIGFASSAGAIYAGSREMPITEESKESPLNSYARNKLSQERLFSEFAMQHENVGLMIARLSTLYGPGQDWEKSQGLISKISRSAIRHCPVEIFVPLDTARDYLFIDDAAEGMIFCMEASRLRQGKVHLKILANERSVTISQIIGTFNDVMKTRLRVIHTKTGTSSHYLPKMSFESTSDLRLPHGYVKHTLLEGISSLVQSELKAYAKGAGNTT